MRGADCAAAAIDKLRFGQPASLFTASLKSCERAAAAWQAESHGCATQHCVALPVDYSGSGDKACAIKLLSRALLTRAGHPGEPRKLNMQYRLAAVLGLSIAGSGCNPSGRDIAERAAAMEAAERASAHQANAQRAAEAAAAASAEAVRGQAATAARKAAGVGYGCIPETARRAIARMEECGLNVTGFTPENMCEKLGQAKLLYLASRNCHAIGEIISGAGAD